MGQEHLLGLKKLKFIVHKDVLFWMLLTCPHHELLVNGSLDTCSTALPQNNLDLLVRFSPDLQHTVLLLLMCTKTLWFGAPVFASSFCLQLLLRICAIWVHINRLNPLGESKLLSRNFSSSEELKLLSNTTTNLTKAQCVLPHFICKHHLHNMWNRKKNRTVFFCSHQCFYTNHHTVAINKAITPLLLSRL